MVLKNAKLSRAQAWLQSSQSAPEKKRKKSTKTESTTDFNVDDEPSDPRFDMTGPGFQANAAEMYKNAEEYDDSKDMDDELDELSDDGDAEDVDFSDIAVDDGDGTHDGNGSTQAGELDNEAHPTKNSQPILAPLNPKALARFQEKLERTGILYMSRVPPFMKPEKVRNLLSKYAQSGIGRIYLAPEDSKVAARRKKYRGNKRDNFTEGWIEFADKREAKSIAALLNGHPIGGKKRERYYDDIWNLKYLPKFKWTHLNEQIAYERAVRAQKLRAEMQQAKRENKAYLANVGKAKMVEAIEEKKRKRAAEKGDAVGDAKLASTADTESSTNALRRQFRQRKAIDPDAKISNVSAAHDKKTSVLRKIFS